MSRLDELTVEKHIDQVIVETDFPGLGRLERGKVRDSYVRRSRRYLIATDRISAFDVVLGAIPFKGQVLNQMAAYWFEVTEEIAPNHVLSVPDPNVTEAVDCRPFPVEMVVRGYLTGSSSTSIWKAYESGAREFCGHPLADGMRRHQRLPQPLLTPSTKADVGEHDRSVSKDEILAMGLVTAEQFEQMEAYAMALFDFGTRHAAERGLILVDTKYEFGLDDHGKILLIDEVHTPDSSRYWYADDYQARFDAAQEPRSLYKEFVRRSLIAQGYAGEGAPPPLDDDLRVEAAARYVEIFEQVTGTSFEGAVGDPVSRIRAALGLAR